MIRDRRHIGALGIGGGTILMVEDRLVEVVLRPSVVLEVQQYRGDDIEKWDADDQLDDREQARILDAMTRSKKQ